jgi:signal recognition particle subunit SRP14
MGSPPVTKNLPDRFDDLRPSSPLPVLIRATNGKSKEKKNEKIKLSTIVQPDALEAFYLRYADICKSGMQGLKKRDRSGRKKTKSKKRKVGVEGDRRV